MSLQNVSLTLKINVNLYFYHVQDKAKILEHFNFVYFPLVFGVLVVMYFNSIYILNLIRHHYFLVHYEHSFKFTHIFILLIALYLFRPLSPCFHSRSFFFCSVSPHYGGFADDNSSPFLPIGKCLLFYPSLCVWRSRALLAAEAQHMLIGAVLLDNVS